MTKFIDVKGRSFGSPLSRGTSATPRASTAEVVLNSVEDCKKPVSPGMPGALAAVKKKLTGFTLMELIIVTVILGILAAIAIPMYTNTVEQRRGEVCINNMRMIFAAWEIYNMKNPSTPYNPEGFVSVNTINQDLGISIDERNFGEAWATTNHYGFVMYVASPILPQYVINAYRQSGHYYNSYIGCNYWPNGNEVGGITYYYMWVGDWHWLPQNE